MGQRGERRGALALVLGGLLAGCWSPGDACLGASRCEGTTLVECRSSRNNFGTVYRTTCPVACVTPRTGAASCAESATRCDPSSFLPYCAQHSVLPEVVRCVNLASSDAAPEHFAIASQAACSDDGTRAYSCDGLTLRSTPCVDGNQCLLSLGATLVSYCGDASGLSCDPDARPRCQGDRSTLRCEDAARAGFLVRVRHAPGSPEALADCR